MLGRWPLIVTPGPSPCFCTACSVYVIYAGCYLIYAVQCCLCLSRERCARGTTETGIPLKRFRSNSFDAVVDAFGLCSHDDPVRVSSRSPNLLKKGTHRRSVSPSSGLSHSCTSLNISFSLVQCFGVSLFILPPFLHGAQSTNPTLFSGA